MQRRGIPVMVIAALGLYPVLHNSFLGRPESFALLLVFAILTALTVIGAKTQKAAPLFDIDAGEEFKRVKSGGSRSPLRISLLVITGLAGLAFGAHLTVESAVFIGKHFGLSDAVIGLTIIAVGTSLPELMTSIVAAFKGHEDLSIGNLVGSNVFNTLLVVGAAGAIRPFRIAPRLIGADYWIMIGVCVFFMSIVLVWKRISRLGGAALLGIYFAYVAYLFICTRSA